MLFERNCPVCGRAARFVCERCWSALEPAVGRSVFVYDETARAIVLTAKNRGRRDLWRPLGRALAQEVTEPVDVVTWVPASRSHRRRRGYDQGRLLARSVSRTLGVPSRSLLRRVGDEPQTGKGRSERLDGPGLRPRTRSVGRILVVDDVRTTGASLQEAASVLLSAGAAAVTMASVASVSPPAPATRSDLC